MLSNRSNFRFYEKVCGHPGNRLKVSDGLSAGAGLSTSVGQRFVLSFIQEGQQFHHHWGQMATALSLCRFWCKNGHGVWLWRARLLRLVRSWCVGRGWFVHGPKEFIHFGILDVNEVEFFWCFWVHDQPWRFPLLIPVFRRFHRVGYSIRLCLGGIGRRLGYLFSIFYFTSNSISARRHLHRMRRLLVSSIVKNQWRAKWSLNTVNSSCMRNGGRGLNAQKTQRKSPLDDEWFSSSVRRYLDRRPIGFRSSSGWVWNNTQSIS